MSDKVLIWSVWLTAGFMLGFSVIAVSVEKQGKKDDIAICGQRQNKIEKHIEVLRMQMLQLERVNAKQLRR